MRSHFARVPMLEYCLFQGNACQQQAEDITGFYFELEIIFLTLCSSGKVAIVLTDSPQKDTILPLLPAAGKVRYALGNYLNLPSEMPERNSKPCRATC